VLVVGLLRESRIEPGEDRKARRDSSEDREWTDF
jgi:hypothetical protein